MSDTLADSALAEVDPGGGVRPASPYPLPYGFEQQQLDNGDWLFTLTRTGGGYRKCVASELESPIMRGVLLGIEYPMHPAVVELCKGLPVVDIGAHFGSASVYFRELLRPSKLTAFEPNPTALKYLARNVSTFQDSIRRLAVSCAVGSFPLSVGKYSCCASLVGSLPGDERVTVQCVTGREALRYSSVNGEIGLLKIDAEFSELDILLSAGDLLSQCRVIWLEYHDDTMRRLCDQLLHEFEPFYVKGSRKQGVIGYFHRRFNKELPEYCGQEWPTHQW